jgi:DNA modification methylase
MSNLPAAASPIEAKAPRRFGGLIVVEKSISELKPYPKNARTHSRRQIEQIVNSFKQFGIVQPIIVDEDSVILCGHGRLDAGLLLGLTTVPTIQISHLTEIEKRKLRLSDNKIAANAGWNAEVLALELNAILDFDSKVDFDLGLAGFETAELDLILSDTRSKNSDDVVEPIDARIPPVSQLGDLWQCDRHRIYCGDIRDRRNCTRLMDGARADLVFTDAPYNLKIDGHVSGLGRVHHREFLLASGELSSAEFTAFLATSFSVMAQASKPGAIFYACMDWRHTRELLTASESLDVELINLCVWDKGSGGMGSLYRSRHEFVFVFKCGGGRHVNNVELGRHGRNRTNVWNYPGANSFEAEARDTLAIHPTVKPIALVADAILDCSHRNGRVLDGFLGSGTTIIAAERTGRVGYGMELDAVYVDAALRRWTKLFGEEPMLEGTGEKFSQVAERRSREAPALTNSAPVGDPQ